MKTLVFLLLSSFSIGTFSNPTSNDTNEDQASRQCCSYLVDFDGFMVEVTACSGWLLSDDANSMARACEKAKNIATTSNFY